MVPGLLSPRVSVLPGQALPPTSPPPDGHGQLSLPPWCQRPLGRVENSKTFQNQMAQCFFIGLYDIETGDDFYFFQKFFFDGWKWILKKSIFTREKWLK